MEVKVVDISGSNVPESIVLWSPRNHLLLHPALDQLSGDLDVFIIDNTSHHSIFVSVDLFLLEYKCGHSLVLLNL